jgi:DNA-binding NtrC family response regulator
MTDQTPKPHRLLVIDDEAIVGKRLSQIFTKMGFVVAAHVDPLQALAAAEQEPFDVVVTDLKMQGLDGIEVLRRIKKSHPATRVIIITGYAEMDTADTAFREGVFDFIPKPFRLDEIKEAILRAVAEPTGPA